MTFGWQAILAALFPPGALTALLVWMLRSRDLRFDSRMRRTDSFNECSFVVANAAEEPLLERVTLVFEVMLRHGRFLAEPIVLCGPKMREFRAGFVADDFDTKNGLPQPQKAVARPSERGSLLPVSDETRYVVSVPCFRPLSTWVVLCRTNGLEGDLRMHVHVDGKREATVRGSVRPSLQPWRAWIVWATTSVFGCLSYLVPRLVLWGACGPWDAVDYGLLGSIALLSSAAFMLLWERRRYPVLGYQGWDSPSFEGA